MSDDEQITETITAEFKDGQLQIVELSPSGRNTPDSQDENDAEVILPDGGIVESNDGPMKRYVEVVDPSGKGVMRLDLMNLTFVRCGAGDDEQGEYQLVSSDDIMDAAIQDEESCVIEQTDNSGGEEQSETYVVVNDHSSSLMFLQPDTDTVLTEEAPVLADKTIEKVPEKSKETEGKSKEENKLPEKTTIKRKRKQTPQELIDKVKELQKIKVQIAAPPSKKRGRKPASEVPSPRELLASPSFKLYLYSCKYCSFKCNATKELTAHKNTEHASGNSKFKGPARLPAMQCARCPYRAATQPQLMKHAREKHLMEVVYCQNSDATEEGSSDVNLLVCGGCGFESTSREDFKEHIQKNHMS